MKTILIKGGSALCSALLTFAIAAFVFERNSSAASEQLEGSQRSAQEHAQLNENPILEPVLAVNRSPKGTGRPTIINEEGLVYADFVMEPFEIKKSNERHGWTMVDARHPKQIDRLSHNDEERERHLEENIWVSYRELVYRKETFAGLVSQAQENQEELKELILPGIEGKEYRVEVLDIDDRIENGVHSGSISGRLVGDPTSEVNLGYHGERESGGILSTEQEIFISYDPREDGQIIVKQVDDEALTYAFSEATCNTIHGSHEVGEPNAEL